MLNTLPAIRKFFELLKIKIQPHEDALTKAMQLKVDWIKKASTYNLNDAQRQSIARDKALIATAENYISIQQEIIAHLFTRLEHCAAEIEGLKTDAAFLLTDKLNAEQDLQTLIKAQHEAREVQQAT